MTNQLITDGVLYKLKEFSDYHSLSSLFVVGSYGRSAYLNQEFKINKLEIASTDLDSMRYLGSLFCTEVLGIKPAYDVKRQTTFATYKNITIEFQDSYLHEYMKNAEIAKYLTTVPDIPLLHNLYSRNFSIDALIYSVNNLQLYDPLKRAVSDIDKELIVSILPAELLIKYNPSAILNAIELSLSLDFYIENKLSLVMQKHSNVLFESLSKDRIMKQVINILHINAERGLEALKKYSLDNVLLSKEIKELVYSAKE